MRYIIYDEKADKVRMYEHNEVWDISPNGAKKYLEGHVLKSLEHEFTPAYKAYEGEGEGGFFSLLRILFPFITYIGRLACGQVGTKDRGAAIKFMRKYMSKADSRYKELSCLVYMMYRNSLMHLHGPNIYEIDEKIVGWEISFCVHKHLQMCTVAPSRLDIVAQKKSLLLTISPKKMFEDLKVGLQEYIDEMLNEDQTTNQKTLLTKFKAALKDASRLHEEGELTKTDCEEPVDYVKQRKFETPHNIQSIPIDLQLPTNDNRSGYP